MEGLTKDEVEKILRNNFIGGVEGRKIYVKYERLTKKFLLSLKKGEFITSTCYDGFTSVYAGYIVAKAEREQQWIEIRASGANHRHCTVFKNTRDYADYEATILLNKRITSSSQETPKGTEFQVGNYSLGGTKR